MKTYLDKKREEFRRRPREGNNPKRAKASQFKEGFVPHDPEALARKIKTQLQDIAKKIPEKNDTSISFGTYSCTISRQKGDGASRTYTYDLLKLTIKVRDTHGLYYDDYGNTSYSRNMSENKKESVSRIGANSVLKHFDDTLREFGLKQPPLGTSRNWTFPSNY